MKGSMRFGIPAEIRFLQCRLLLQRLLQSSKGCGGGR